MKRRALFPLAAALAAAPAAAAPPPGSAMPPPASGAPVASAAPAPHGSAMPPPHGSAMPASRGACVERIPEGKERPKLTEKVPSRGISGHALPLTLVIEHGPGETVLPSGFALVTNGDEFKSLEAAHFFLPEPAGGAGPKLSRTESGGRATTTVELRFVPLPEKPGRNELVLPPLPIAVSRASGELMTLCTSAHPIAVEDPIANLPNAKPKRNPAPRRQLEEWTLAKHVTIAALVAAVAGALLATLISIWRRRPKREPPAPPPRPPHEVALEALFDVRHAGLLEAGRLDELYDRVSEIVRRYLGDRYGYDGLESTTREALAALRRVAVPLEALITIQQFMQDADLVKFARRAPSEEECRAALAAAEAIIEKTRPADALAEALAQADARAAAADAAPEERP